MTASEPCRLFQYLKENFIRQTSLSHTHTHTVIPSWCRRLGFKLLTLDIPGSFLWRVLDTQQHLRRSSSHSLCFPDLLTLPFSSVSPLFLSLSLSHTSVSEDAEEHNPSSPRQSHLNVWLWLINTLIQAVRQKPNRRHPSFPSGVTAVKTPPPPPDTNKRLSRRLQREEEDKSAAVLRGNNRANFPSQTNCWKPPLSRGRRGCSFKEKCCFSCAVAGCREKGPFKGQSSKEL